MYLVAQKDGKIRKRHGNQLQARLTGRDEKDRKLNDNHDWMDVTEEIDSDEEEPGVATPAEEAVETLPLHAAEQPDVEATPAPTRRYPLRNRRPINRPGFVHY